MSAYEIDLLDFLGPNHLCAFCGCEGVPSNAIPYFRYACSCEDRQEYIKAEAHLRRVSAKAWARREEIERELESGRK